MSSAQFWIGQGQLCVERNSLSSKLAVATSSLWVAGLREAGIRPHSGEDHGPSSDRIFVIAQIIASRPRFS
jgi:hypothetical protein